MIQIADKTQSKRPRRLKMGSVESESILTNIEAPEQPIEFCTVINTGHIVITLPLRTLSPNQSEPWRKRYAREKAQRRAVMFAMIAVKEKIPQAAFAVDPGKIKLKFTRYAPKGLDAHDNLPMSVKKICDQVCAEIMCDYVPGRADGAACFEFEYAQVKTKAKIYGVKIEIKY